MTVRMPTDGKSLRDLHATQSSKIQGPMFQGERVGLQIRLGWIRFPRPLPVFVSWEKGDVDVMRDCSPLV